MLGQMAVDEQQQLGLFLRQHFGSCLRGFSACFQPPKAGETVLVFCGGPDGKKPGKPNSSGASLATTLDIEQNKNIQFCSSLVPVPPSSTMVDNLGLQAARGSAVVTQEEAIEALARVGMVANPPWARGMLILNEAHPAIEQMYAGSRWKNGAWRETLLKLPGATRLPPIWLGGIEGTLIAIPMDLPVIKNLLQKAEADRSQGR